MSSAVAKKVRSLLLNSRTALVGSRSGFFKTKNSGSGYDFDQLVEYSEGADVRRIDWKSSARSNTLLLREYKDEQQRVMHLVVDTSSSLEYGSQKLLLSQVCADLVAAFECIASHTDDSVIKHAGGEQRVGIDHRIKALMKRFTRRSLVVVISDFIDKDYQKSLSLLAHQHEVIVIRLRDVREAELIYAYTHVLCQDREQEGLFCPLDSKKKFDAEGWRTQQAQFFKKLPLAWMDCFNDGTHIERLVSFINRY